METLSPISKRISLLLRKSHKRPHLSVGYFTKKMGICQGLFLAGTVPRTGTFVLFYLLIHCRLCRLPVAPAKLSARCSARDLGQHRTIRREPVARDFSSAESLENRGILGVFPVFQTARMGEKTRHPAADAFVRCCLSCPWLLTLSVFHEA